MSADVEATIKQTAELAKRLLFDRHGKLLKGEPAKVARYTLSIVIPKAKAAEVLHPMDGQIFFDWQGSTHVYNEALGEILIQLARAGDSLSDRALCCASAVMLDALRGIPDAKLRTYAGSRLTDGLPLVAKRKRGERKSADTTFRDT